MNNRIAIAINNNDQQTKQVAEHFAQSSEFIVYEINENQETVKTETYFNPLKNHQSGTCQLPGYLNQFAINTIIAGGMGQKAIMNFHQFGIQVITAPRMNCEEALSQFLSKKIDSYEECTGHGDNHNCGE